MSEHFGLDGDVPGDGLRPDEWGADGLGGPDLGDPDLGEPDLGDPGLGGHDLGDAGFADPGFGDPGIGDPGFGDHVFGDHVFGDHGAADPDPYGFDHDPGDHDPGGHHPGGHEPGDHDAGDDGPSELADEGPGVPDHGAEPDSLGQDPSTAGIDLSYPPPLDVDVAPSDGLDWVDPDLLGTEDVDAGPHFAAAEPDELLASIHSADGGDGEPTWAAMHASDDPATRALAAFWDPLGR